MKKKINEEMISLDHFITTVFNENTSMNVMFIDDTIEDLNKMKIFFVEDQSRF